MVIETNVIRAHQATGAYAKADFISFDVPEPQELVEQQPIAPVDPLAFEIPAGTPDSPVEAAAETEAIPATADAINADTHELRSGEDTYVNLEDIRLPTAEEIEGIHQQAQKEGYAAGYEEGSARGRLEAAELHSLVTEIDATLSAFDKTVGEEVLSLALEVARLVVRDTIATRPEVVTSVIREALLQSPMTEARIHLNPEDMDLARQYLGDQLAQAGQRLFEDATVERGGCRIETAGAHIDATIATRWKRVTEALSSQQSTWEKEEA